MRLRARSAVRIVGTVTPEDKARAELEAVMVDCAARAEAARDEAGLYALQVEVLGKSGSVTRLRELLGKLPPEGKREFGRLYNEKQQALEALFAAFEAGKLHIFLGPRGTLYVCESSAAERFRQVGE